MAICKLHKGYLNVRLTATYNPCFINLDFNKMITVGYCTLSSSLLFHLLKNLLCNSDELILRLGEKTILGLILYTLRAWKSSIHNCSYSTCFQWYSQREGGGEGEG